MKKISFWVCMATVAASAALPVQDAMKTPRLRDVRLRARGNLHGRQPKRRRVRVSGENMGARERQREQYDMTCDLFMGCILAHLDMGYKSKKVILLSPRCAN